MVKLKAKVREWPPIIRSREKFMKAFYFHLLYIPKYNTRIEDFTNKRIEDFKYSWDRFCEVVIISFGSWRTWCCRGRQRRRAEPNQHEQTQQVWVNHEHNPSTLLGPNSITCVKSCPSTMRVVLSPTWDANML